jgi:hypothetical protein
VIHLKNYGKIGVLRRTFAYEVSPEMEVVVMPRNSVNDSFLPCPITAPIEGANGAFPLLILLRQYG